ncbi:hypothetical protein [Micrococcus endophyticus]|uniref:Uncharacterized protein n=1 Tax=Micrococcus endophyticus TaxID=455343 RepID=A0A4Y8ZJR9_9MICC|nr:hypothetical protein [Micrococcus endophyticus]MBB5848666.1 hypothetical protein [Micrococcus endophyticus]TFI50672.1 hypothetical protein E4A41_00315 [Micrococcus endophyticus]
MLYFLDARASEFDTIASALGLYSAGLLGVFSILTSWRSRITKRRPKYKKIEDRWARVIDRAVLLSLRGSALSFSLMLFGVIAPAVKRQIGELFPIEVYSFLARSTSAVSIAGVILLGLISLQIVRDIAAVYEWNNVVESEEAIVEGQKKKLGGARKDTA